MSAGNPWKTRATKGKRKARSALRARGTDIYAAMASFNAYEFLCRQQECKEWIAECINEELSIESITHFMEALRNGVYLCKLANVILPGSIPKIYDKTRLEFQYTENINNFLRVCDKVGLQRSHHFTVPDLWERKNSTKVVHCIHSLSALLEAQGFQTPKMKNLQGKVEFSEEELNQANEELKKIEGDQEEASNVPLPEEEIFAGEKNYNPTQPNLTPPPPYPPSIRIVFFLES
eukprot:GEZU01011124.1.p1 GENE.GEZU01011124.1~~GEZU01011124.1.p1  ORF type:complete len:234 (+),score=76.49 GEZU01011124.1:39-740(+)